MEAMKAAKEKAAYLLGAIHEKVGKPVFVKEIEEDGPAFRAGLLSSNSNISANVLRYGSGSTADTDSDLSFSQIKLRFVILAKFEIE